MIESLFPNGISLYLLGGALVGVGIAIPFLATGLVAGVSTVFTSSWSYVSARAFFHEVPFRSTRHWRIALAAGLVTGGILFAVTLGASETYSTSIEWWRLLLGGIIIGIGTRMSGGCASGHGVCGNASLQPVSLFATITFLLVAICTAQVTQLFF